LLAKRLRSQLHKLFITRGLGLKSYKIVSEIICYLKKETEDNAFSFISKVLVKVFPYCVVKKVTRGKHRIVLLLPIQYNRAFRVSLNSLKNNSKLIKKKDVSTFSKQFTSELVNTLNKKSQTYKIKLLHLKDIRFSLSFTR